MRRFLLAILIVSLPPALLLSQSKAPKTYKRVQPPKFNKTDPFYADAFKEGLVGERPADLGRSAPGPAAQARNATEGSASPSRTALVEPSSGVGWSRWISATTIEDTIKGLKQQVDKDITTPSDFAGKGYKSARRSYSVLAMLFAIAGEFDGDVRWKKDAAAARDAFARSAANCKVGTAQSFAEAKDRKVDLNDLVGGSSPFAGKEAEAKPDWAKVAGRAPLMQYLESAWEPRLKPLLADKSQFTASSDKVLRDAELFAAIGEVLAKEGMEDADDTEYKAFCARLRDGAKQIIDAVKQKNFDQAAAGSTAIGKACAECHENYRS